MCTHRNNKLRINAMTVDYPTAETRTPSPPYGYSKPCRYTQLEQVHIVAEFHVHRIHPSRIAYRTGIDIAFIDKLLAGESQQKLFKGLIQQYNSKRRQKRLRDSQIVKPRFRGRQLALDIDSHETD